MQPLAFDELNKYYLNRLENPNPVFETQKREEVRRWKEQIIESDSEHVSGSNPDEKMFDFLLKRQRLSEIYEFLFQIDHPQTETLDGIKIIRENLLSLPFPVQTIILNYNTHLFQGKKIKKLLYKEWPKISQLPKDINQQTLFLQTAIRTYTKKPSDQTFRGVQLLVDIGAYVDQEFYYNRTSMGSIIKTIRNDTKSFTTSFDKDGSKLLALLGTGKDSSTNNELKKALRGPNEQKGLIAISIFVLFICVIYQLDKSNPLNFITHFVKEQLR